MRSLYKIVHTTCQTGWGEQEQRIYNESVWMENKGHQVVIITPMGTPLFTRAKEYGFRVHGVSFKRFSAIKDYGQLKQIFKDEQPHFIFTTSDYTTQHLQQVFKLKDMEIFSMPSGIITPQDLAPKNAARKALARDLSLDSATRFIGFVGIGERVHFIGLKDDIWPYYRAFACKILASGNNDKIPFEGVPLALLEAMYSSCPVIGSKTHGITDIIVNKKTGLLFDPHKPEDLADMILDTIANEAATLERVHQARELVRKKHTIDAMGRNIIRIYRLHQVKIARQYLV